MWTPDPEPSFEPFSDGIAPSYDGRGIMNVPNTILQHFGLDAPRAPLAADAVPVDLSGVERVVLVVADGLGWNLVRASDAAERRFRAAVPVTSTTPSTTVAGLASLSTGLPPAEHGLLGYRTLVPHVGAIVNLVRMHPYYAQDSLFDFGVEPETFFPFDSLAGRLKAAGVHVKVVTRDAYVSSGLSRMIYRGATPEGYLGLPDLLSATRRFLDDTVGERAFLEVYWDEVDAVSHRYGPDSDAAARAVEHFVDAFADALGPHVEDPRTVVLVTADHGQLRVPRENVLNVNAHPEVFRNLVLPPTGEGRFAYLHARDGTRARVREAVEAAWPGIVEVFDAETLVDEGLFGAPPHHAELRNRVGSLVAIPHGARKFEYHATPRMGPTALLGNHGGVRTEEMLVPLAAF